MLSQTGREAGLPACSSGLRVTGGAWAAFFASKKSQYKGEAVTQWARDRAGRLPRAFISDSNAAFGAALENLGLEKIVTHEAGNHSEGFRNPEDTTQIPWSGSEGAFTEWYETSRLGASRPGRTPTGTLRCSTSTITSSALTAPLPLREKTNHPCRRGGIQAHGVLKHTHGMGAKQPQLVWLSGRQMFPLGSDAGW